MEMTHGVVISKDDEGRLLARHWQTDDVLADADDVPELETVLKSLHIYIDSDEDARLLTAEVADNNWKQP